MSIDVHVVPARVRRTLIVGGLFALAASLIGLVLGWILVDSVSEDLGGSVGSSESALLAIEETLGVVETATAEVDDGLVAASDSIAAASDAAQTAAGRLEDVADFLDGDLRANIEALHGSMPAAIQAAGAIDDTLRALALFGVDYNPDEPFDVSLMAVDEALTDLPEELSSQAEAIRALVPTSQQFAADAGELSESFSSLGASLEASQGIIDSYRTTLAQAQEVVDDTGSSLTVNMWLLRLLVLMMALAGAALSIGLIMVGRHLSETVVPVDEAEAVHPVLD